MYSLRVKNNWSNLSVSGTVVDGKLALQTISRGHCCLWVGAGIAVHIGGPGSTGVPSWLELVDALEREAAVQPPPGLTDFPPRLDMVLTKIGRVSFQRELRQRILTPLARSIVDVWRTTRKTPPDVIVALAHLGTLANPIVNFNIETISSQALVAGSGPWYPVVFRPPVADAVTDPILSRQFGDGKRHQRRVYHPHGAIDMSGICVMTEREYRSMDATLAFQLAVHAAFGLDLVIVGMSLEDRYLRIQLEQFRHQIESVTWLVSSTPSEALAEWAYRAQVSVVKVSWPDFWSEVVKQLPGPEEPNLAYEWILLVEYALKQLGQPETDSTNDLLFVVGLDPAQKASWFLKAAMHGESPKYEPISHVGPPEPGSDEDRAASDRLETWGRLYKILP